MTLGTLARYSQLVQSTESATGLDKAIAMARQLNSLYCYSSDKKHLWPIANRHLWRMMAMYRGGKWEHVDIMGQHLGIEVPR